MIKIFIFLIFVSNRIVNGIECLTCEGNLDSDCKIAQNVQIHQCDQGINWCETWISQSEIQRGCYSRNFTPEEDGCRPDSSFNFICRFACNQDLCNSHDQFGEQIEFTLANSTTADSTTTGPTEVSSSKS